MDAKTLSDAMGGTLSDARYADLAPAFTDAMRRAGCTTVDRAAMWCAQLGHESAGLRYMEEIASGAAYEGRSDLGNTRPGDGRRFKGRGPIQVTGRSHYTNLSKWAHSKGYVPTADYFVDHPDKLAGVQYGFLGAVWYWTTQRPMNTYADRGDIRAASIAVNGGLNGYADRVARWNRCRKLGKQLLAGSTPAADTSSGKRVKTVTEHKDVFPTAGSIHTPYGRRGPYWSYDRDKNGNGVHTGDDWHTGGGAKDIGNPIYAVADGRVIYAGSGGGWGPAFGNHVLITWTRRIKGESFHRTSLDAHMSKLAVRYGQQVKAGDLIGYVGQTGNVSGPHDHHEQHAGQGWGDRRLKPVYPGTTITTTVQAEGVPIMAKPKKLKRTKPQKLKKRKAYHSILLNNRSTYTAQTFHDDATFYLVADITTDHDTWARVITVDYKKGAKTKINYKYPRKKIKAGGDQLVQYDATGNPPKGYSRRVRIQVLAYSRPITVRSVFTRTGKEE